MREEDEPPPAAKCKEEEEHEIWIASSACGIVDGTPTEVEGHQPQRRWNLHSGETERRGGGGAMPQTPTILRQRIGQAERVGARVWEP